MSNLVLTETFLAVQGEGMFTGTPSFFLRTAGCSVKCPACDTIYSWAKERPEGLASGQYVRVPSEDIVIRIVESALKYVVVTGGEPAEQADEMLDVLSHEALRGRYFTIETSGNVEFDPVPYTLLSISPKMTGMMRRDLPLDRYDHLRGMIDSSFKAGRLVQLKYVVKDERDYFEAKDLTLRVVPEQWRSRIHIVFQPNNDAYRDGISQGENLANYCQNLKALSSMFIQDQCAGGTWDRFPHTRLMVQQHWLSHGMEPGT